MTKASQGIPTTRAKDMSDSADPIACPRDRDKALSCAYLRHIGYTQAAAAKAAGVDPRTLGRWESCSWWHDIRREAADRWLAGLAATARGSLERGVAEDGRLALSVLERLEPALAPPRHRTVGDAENGSNLLALPFWRFVLSLHLVQGISIEEAQLCARRDPEAVRQWAEARGLLSGSVGGELDSGERDMP